MCFLCFKLALSFQFICINRKQISPPWRRWPVLINLSTDTFHNMWTTENWILPYHSLYASGFRPGNCQSAIWNYMTNLSTQLAMGTWRAHIWLILHSLKSIQVKIFGKVPKSIKMFSFHNVINKQSWCFMYLVVHKKLLIYLAYQCWPLIQHKFLMRSLILI